MAKIKVKQVKRQNRTPSKSKKNFRSIRFTKMNQVVEHEATPTIIGMVNTVKHLVSFEEIK